MTHCVFSVGATRLLDGMGLGAGTARREAMVVLVEEFRLTKPASGSVPVFTDQRSTPHCAYNAEGTTRRITASNKQRRRRCCIIHPPGSVWGPTATTHDSWGTANQIQRLIKNCGRIHKMERTRARRPAEACDRMASRRIPRMFFCPCGIRAFPKESVSKAALLRKTMSR